MKLSVTQHILRIILGLFMLLAGIGHLSLQRQEFLAQAPSWLPGDSAFADFVVLSSGLIEIALGLSMIFLVRYTVRVGLVLAAFFVLIFPGNVSQYLNGIDAFGLDTDQKRLIRLFFQPVLIFWALWSTGALAYLINRSKEKRKAKNQVFFDFEATGITNEAIKMSRYRGNVIIVVNTAGKCGLTPQYEGLEELYKKYKDRGLTILGFPCNGFGAQEPGTDAEISAFCQLNYGVSFPMFSKVEVNGENAHSLFTFLKNRLPGFLGRSAKWNFTKFVIDRDGIPVRRFSPVTKPAQMEKFIERLLIS